MGTFFLFFILLSHNTPGLLVSRILHSLSVLSTACYGYVMLQHVTAFPALFTVVGPLFLNPICSETTCGSAWSSLGCDTCPEARCSARDYSISGGF